MKVNLGDDPRPNFYKWLTSVQSIPCQVITEATIKNVRREQDETTKLTTEIRLPPRRDLELWPGKSSAGVLVLVIVYDDLLPAEYAYIGSIKHIAENYTTFLGTEYQGDTADYIP